MTQNGSCQIRGFRNRASSCATLLIITLSPFAEAACTLMCDGIMPDDLLLQIEPDEIIEQTTCLSQAQDKHVLQLTSLRC